MQDQAKPIDLSHELDSSTPAFPGDPPVEIEVLDAADRPSTAGEPHLNCTRISCSVHCGTHMDAPFHFYMQGAAIDRVPLDVCIGPALHLRFPRGARQAIDSSDLLPHQEAIERYRRVILNTGWHHHWNQPDYFAEHPVLTGSAAEFLASCGVLLVGVDFPSVDRLPFPAHLVLLGRGIVILENLANLDAIEGELFQLIALPLKIAGRDGSPVRAVALPLALETA